MSTPEDGMREFGGAFFGSHYRFAIGMWVVRQEIGTPFNCFELAEGINIPLTSASSIASRFLPGFQRFAMIDRLGTGRMEPTVAREWARKGSPYWQLFTAANDVFYPEGTEKTLPYVADSAGARKTTAF